MGTINQIMNNQGQVSIKIVSGLCWMGMVVGILGAKLIPLLVGILFAVAAVGILKRKLWAGVMAGILAGIHGFSSVVVFFITDSGETALGHVFLIAFYLAIIVGLAISWDSLKHKDYDNREQRGTM